MRKGLAIALGLGFRLIAWCARALQPAASGHGRKDPRGAVTLPGAMYVSPLAWSETDKENLSRYLSTPGGAKFLLTLHDLVTARALLPVERTVFENGMTAGMSHLLGEIERMAVDGEPENSESEE